MEPQEQQSDEPVLNSAYWNQAAFHAALTRVPFKQRDAAGALVVNVNDHFFKLDAGTLVMARVPEDLSIPTNWQPVADDHPMRDKALSMIGTEVGQ
jgi:hypothetical protein